MTRDVILNIVAVQEIDGERETIKLLTEGTLHREDDALILSYQETELTGLLGTTTAFRIEPERVILTRTGALQSKMTFEIGKEDCSLYDMGFGALMVTVCAQRIDARMTDFGGTLTVAYAISVEDQTAGWMEYDIEVKESSHKSAYIA